MPNGQDRKDAYPESSSATTRSSIDVTQDSSSVSVWMPMTTSWRIWKPFISLLRSWVCLSFIHGINSSTFLHNRFLFRQRLRARPCFQLLQGTVSKRGCASTPDTSIRFMPFLTRSFLQEKSKRQVKTLYYLGWMNWRSWNDTACHHSLPGLRYTPFLTLCPSSRALFHISACPRHPILRHSALSSVMSRTSVFACCRWVSCIAWEFEWKSIGRPTESTLVGKTPDGILHIRYGDQYRGMFIQFLVPCREYFETTNLRHGS